MDFNPHDQHPKPITRFDEGGRFRRVSYAAYLNQAGTRTPEYPARTSTPHPRCDHAPIYDGWRGSGPRWRCAKCGQQMSR